MTPSVALAILLVLAVLWAVSAQAACSSMRRGTALRDDALEDLQLRYSRLQAEHDDLLVWPPARMDHSDLL